MSKKQKESLVPLISTLIVAVLAIGMAIAAMLILKGDKTPDTPSSTPSSDTSVSAPSFELAGEQKVTFETEIIPNLVDGNRRVISMFVTDGLAYEPEPYGNDPEDELYTVADPQFTTLEQIEEFVRSIYTEDETRRIMTNIDGRGLAVYQNRKKLVKVEETYEGTAESTAESDDDGGSVHYKEEYVLGISMNFKGDDSYNMNWLDLNYSYDFVTETECNVTLYFNGYDPSAGASAASPEDVLQLKMVKIGDEWRLTALVY